MPTVTLNLRSAHNLLDFGGSDGGPGSFLELMRQTFPERASGRRRRERNVVGDRPVLQAQNIQHYDDGRFFVRIVGFIDGQEAPVVPNRGSSVRLYAPPNDGNYLTRELMMLVHSDRVIICRRGLSDSALQTFIETSAVRQGIDAGFARTSFRNRADLDRLRSLQRGKVHKIHIRATARDFNVKDMQNEQARLRIIGSAWQELRQIFGDDDDSNDNRDVKVAMAINVHKRKIEEMNLEDLQAFAEDLVQNDDEGFVIETRDNQKIEATDLVLKKRIVVRSYGSSISLDDTKREMEEFDRYLGMGGT